MFALEFAPLLGRTDVSLLGLILGWLLQWQKKTIPLPFYQHLCMGLILHDMQQFLSLDMDALLLCLVLTLTFWRISHTTRLGLQILALLLFPTTDRQFVLVGDVLGTALFVQAQATPPWTSALRLLSAWLHTPHVWTFTALFAAFNAWPMQVLGSVLLTAWFGSARTTVVEILGLIEWIYYISTQT